MEPTEKKTGLLDRGALRATLRRPICLYAALTFGFLVLFLLSCAVFRLSVPNLFFRRCADAFMDFFNSIRDAAQGGGAYTDRGIIYPPLADLIFLILSRLTPDYYNNTSAAERYSCWWTPACVIVLVLCLMAMIALYLIVVNRVLRGHPARIRRVAAVATLFSYPLMYMIERGNILFLTLVLVMLYAVWWDSEDKREREWALICLAAAAAIKLYPAIFGLLLLKRKRWREILRCIGYFLLLILIPSFFVGGPKILVTLVENCLVFFRRHTQDASFGDTSVAAILRAVLSAFGANYTPSALVSWGTMFAGVGISLAAFFLFRERDLEWLSLSVLLLLVPGAGGVYAWSYTLVALLLFFNRQPVRRDLVYFGVLMSVYLLVPIQFTVRSSDLFFPCLMASVAVILYLLLFFGEVLAWLLRHRVRAIRWANRGLAAVGACVFVLCVTGGAVASYQARHPEPMKTFEWVGGGSGTSWDPYRIASKEHLYTFAETVNGGYDFEDAYVRLECDVDFMGESWQPIGGVSKTTFRGIFDGGGHILSHAVIEDTTPTADVEQVAFFGAFDGILMNLCLRDCTVVGEFGAGLVGSNETGGSLILNCGVLDLIYTEKQSVSLIASYFFGTVYGCFAVDRATEEPTAPFIRHPGAGSVIDTCFMCGSEEVVPPPRLITEADILSDTFLPMLYQCCKLYAEVDGLPSAAQWQRSMFENSDINQYQNRRS